MGMDASGLNKYTSAVSSRALGNDGQLFRCKMNRKHLIGR